MTSHQIPALQMAEDILKEYRTLDCACCDQFFGYVHRQTGDMFCCGICLSVGPIAPFPHNSMSESILLKPRMVFPVFPPAANTKETEKSRESICRVPKIERLSKTKNEVAMNEQARTEPPRIKKTEDVVDQCPSFASKDIKSSYMSVEELLNRKYSEVCKINNDSCDDCGSELEQIENNPFRKKDKTLDGTEKYHFPKEYVKNVVLAETNPFSEENKARVLKHKIQTPKSNSEILEERNPFLKGRAKAPPPSEEKNPFLKTKAEAPTLVEKNSFLKANVKTLDVEEKNPFLKENIKALVLKDKISTLKDDSEVIEERNPFLKGRAKAPPPEAEKNPFQKNNAEAHIVVQKNPFCKEKAMSSARKPISDVNSKMNAEVSCFEDDANAMVLMPSPPIKVTKFSTMKEVVIQANATVLKIRSELPWHFDLNKSMGQILKGRKCYDRGPRDFFFQTEVMFKKLITLQADISKYCWNNAQRKTLEYLTLGQLVFVSYEGETFRGEIIGIPNVDVAEVFFIDYGNTTYIPRNDLSALTEEFFNVPRLCFHCQWDFWLAIDEREISEALAAQITDRFNSCETEGLMPLLEIADGQYLVAIGPKEENANFTIKRFYAAGKVPMKNLRRGIVEPLLTVQRKKYMFKDCVYSPSLQDGAIVKTIFAWNCVSYLVMSYEDQEDVMKLQSLANEEAVKAKTLKRCPHVGEVVLAPYIGELYRAKVVARDQTAKDKVQVMFFDFGDSASLKFGELCEATDKIMKHPIYAMNCMLDGVPEPKAPIILDHAAIEFIGCDLQLQIKKAPVFDSDPFLVTLWNGNKTVNNVLKRVIAAESN